MSKAKHEKCGTGSRNIYQGSLRLHAPEFAPSSTIAFGRGDPITQELPCQSQRQLDELLKVEVLDLLQKVFYTSDAARESFVELCEEEYVQKATKSIYT